MRQLLVIAVVAAASVAGCGASQTTTDWSGKFFSNTHKVDVYDRTYDINDVKILCSSQDGDRLKILVTAPDGTQVTSTRPQDGSRKADIEVTGGSHGSRNLAGGAVWNNVDGEWGFEGDPDDTDSHSVFYLHDGAAICPART